MKVIPLKQSCNQVQEVSWLPNTPTTIASWIYDKRGVIWKVKDGFCNVNNTDNKVTSIKGKQNGVLMLENKTYGLYFH